MANYIYISDTGDAYRNLATDGFFLEKLKQGDIMLYFYVNTRAVIIGRNQNAWRECKLKNMDRDDVQLVRRHSGGGAVYHDAGNLNFSFIANEKDYDIDRQMGVIIDACTALGLNVELSGRNDILLDGKKISGNAYSLACGNRSHHGTLLVDVDMSAFSKYLNVSILKLKAKGISSVRSRVRNLKSRVPDLTVDKMRELVIESFVKSYGEAQPYTLSDEDLADIDARTAHLHSWAWAYGRTPPFDYCIENRFSFGEMQFHFKLINGFVEEAKVYSDSMDTLLSTMVEACMVGVRFSSLELAKSLNRINPDSCINMAEINEIKEFLLTNDF